MHYLSSFALIRGFSQDIVRPTAVNPNINPESLFCSSSAVVTNHLFSSSVYVDKGCFCLSLSIWDSFISSYVFSLKCSKFVVGVDWLKLILIYISHKRFEYARIISQSRGLPGSLDKAVIVMVSTLLPGSAIDDLTTQRPFTPICTEPSGCEYHCLCNLH